MKTSFQGFVALAAVACLLLPSCGSAARLGTDLAVVVTSPATVPLAAVYDSLDWGEETDSAAPIILAPLNIPLHAVKHVAYTFVHAADACVSPIYLLASITPRNDLEPLGLYSLGHGYPWKSAPWPELED